MIKIACLACLVLCFASCSRKKGEPITRTPEGYDLKVASRIRLPLELDEISGVAYYAKDSSVFAINDEKGWLYKIRKGSGIRRWKFSKGADYEDLVLLDSLFYILQSNGNILRLSFGTDNEVTVDSYSFSSEGKTKNEFEILYYDRSKKKLILICKDCESDKKKSLTTYSFDPLTGRYSDSSFSINVNKIAAAMGEEKMKFKPSAAAINPRDSQLYILSAINKMLVITDVDGNFKDSYRIDAKVFKQPEGITFTPKGGMIISNEAAETGVADMLYFPYLKKEP